MDRFATTLPRPSGSGRRRLGAAALALALGAALACAGCVGAPPGTVPASLAGFERTFDMALAAITDQNMNIDVNDRRGGRIVGSLDGDAISATLEPLLDGTIGVSFRQRGDSASGAALLKRVVDAYNKRMAASQTVLPESNP